MHEPAPTIQKTDHTLAEDGGLLTAQQVHKLLDVDKSTIYRMANDGRLPAVRVGRQWRFPARAIEAQFRGSTYRPAPAIVPAVAESVLDVAARSLGVMMVVTDLGGTPLTSIVNASPALEDRMGSGQALRECLTEWRQLAEDPDLAPRLVAGRLGFQCARSFVRSGSELVAMVVAGGVAGDDDPDDALYQLNSVQRNRLLDVLPRVGALLSRTALSSGRNRQ